MEQGSEPEERINLILFRESIWELEDKVNAIMEGIADQEAEAIRLRRLTRLLSERLSKVESRLNQNTSSETN